jgi:hypothetical protein
MAGVERKASKGKVLIVVTGRFLEEEWTGGNVSIEKAKEIKRTRILPYGSLADYERLEFYDDEGRLLEL